MAFRRREAEETSHSRNGLATIGKVRFSLRAWAFRAWAVPRQAGEHPIYITGHLTYITYIKYRTVGISHLSTAKAPLKLNYLL